ncbi:MAG: SymE family type I addiction module toxin [Pseudomonadota bacterium]
MAISPAEVIEKFGEEYSFYIDPTPQSCAAVWKPLEVSFYESTSRRKKLANLILLYPPPYVPWINIRGYWLNKAGFTAGTALRVNVYRECLVIKAIRGSS